MNQKAIEFLYSGFWKVLDWVYPPVCAGCGEPGHRLCPSCKAKIKFVNRDAPNDPDLAVEKLQDLPPEFTEHQFAAFYEGVMRECIHALKYDNNQALGELFSEWLLDLVYRESWPIDMIIPVPLSTERVKQRGYNQSALIAKPLAFKMGVDYAPFGLKRIRNTLSQVGLSVQERRLNVKDAFLANPKIVEGKRVLLIDDVSTTGATIGACAAALKKGKTEAVYCATVAGFSRKIPYSEGTLNQV